MSEPQGFWGDLFFGKPRPTGITVIGGKVGPGHYGSSQWGNDTGFSLPEMLGQEQGSSWIPLGRSLQNPDLGMAWDPRQFEGHALTLAPTRSGKGVSAIIPALLTYAGSCLVVDPKGENAWATAERRRAFGHRVVILDPWGEVNRRYAGGEPVETITTFNPLGALDPSSRDFADDVAAMAAALVVPSPGDPHWGESARELIGGCIAAVVEERPGVATLRDVRRLLQLDKEAFGKAVAAYRKLNPGGLGPRKLAAFTDSSKEVDSFFSTARTQTAFLDSDHLREAIESGGEPFNLVALAAGRVTLYLVIPPKRLETHGRWLRLLMTMALQACGRQATPASLPVLFLLDEFGTVGPMPAIEHAFGLAAGDGAGVRLWCFLQDLTQLKRDYPRSWETFVSNASIVQVLAVRDTTTAEYVAKLIGDMSLYRSERIVQQEINLGPGSPYQRPERHVQAERDVQRPLIYPAELAKMGKDRQILLFAGYDPIRTGRFVYYDTYEWADKYRPIPGRSVKTRADFPGSEEYEHACEVEKIHKQTEIAKARIDKSFETWKLLSRYKLIFFPVLILFNIVDSLHHYAFMAYHRWSISRKVGIRYSEVDEYMRQRSAAG